MTPEQQLASRIAREEQRQAKQRSASAERRSALLREWTEILGNQRAVADALGISSTAVAKSAAARREPREPLPEYLELETPRSAEGVPTRSEWDATPPDERPAAARRAAAAWAARQYILTRLRAVVSEAEQAVGDVLLDAEWTGTTEQMNASMSESLPEGWATRMSEEEYAAVLSLLTDLMESLTDAMRQADDEHRNWSAAASGTPDEAAG